MKWVLRGDRFYVEGSAGLEAATTTRRVLLPLSLKDVCQVRRSVEQGVTRPAAVMAMEQVHGKRVEVVTEVRDELVPICDGLVTDRPGLALTMRSADCLPLIAFDPIHRVVGLAHAGWRGVKAGMPEQLVSAFVSHFQSSASDLQVAIGPGIGPCCYEVGSEFDQFFPGQIEIRSGKRFLDLKKMAVAQLNRAGVSSGQIVLSPWCSSCESELCFSYRREGAAAGRMITCAMLSSS